MIDRFPHGERGGIPTTAVIENPSVTLCLTRKLVLLLLGNRTKPPEAGKN